MAEQLTGSEALSSEQAKTETITPPVVPPFEQDEILGFQADDVEAGAAIGKLLSLLFVYTLIAMAIVSAWTLAASNN